MLNSLRRGIVFALAGSVVVLTAAACSTGQAKQTADQFGPAVHVTRVNRHESLQALRRDSVAVVIAVARSQSATTANGFPVTVTKLDVSDVVTGELGVSSLDIQQLGTATVKSPDTSALLKPDHTYLLYLSIEEADGAKRFVITGDDGVYELRGELFVYIGGPGGRVPTTISHRDRSIYINEGS